LRHSKTSRRSGFTLAEVLVTLAIIAILAAVLLPALNSQVGKGESGRVVSDLGAIQSAVNGFVADVHRYPRTPAQLTTKPLTTDLDINSAAYNTLANKWKGPYLSKVASSTGMGGSISPSFVSLADGGSNYLTVVLTGIPTADFNSLDEILDEGNTGLTTGSLRQVPASTTINYLAVPIQ
nr:prepilin-type N-terminal cleavage/methylation domain-containing protein [Gemmatimonadaceae bacterium]